MDAREARTAGEKRNPRTVPLKPVRRPVPVAGDILVSRRSARADAYTITVVPTSTPRIAARYQEALQHARELAEESAVDGWYTCDHTHFVRIARHRELQSRPHQRSRPA